jgi:2-polyprenyl-3-methyl-5-hydroxy-6-metoxy-1,4-benzoquinol methylase
VAFSFTDHGGDSSMSVRDSAVPPAARTGSEPERFAFGKNWARFLSVLNENRIREAERSLREMLGREDLSGARFLDIGSGSGLSSLAARRLGARVHSFDFDPDSVACTEELKRRFFPADPDWTVERGSALDSEYVRGLGLFDVVYSWGVLHHTGSMWAGLENAALAVAPGGTLFLSIYNDQGVMSAFWARIKKTYNRLPRALRPAFAAAILLPWEAGRLGYRVAIFQAGEYVRSWTQYHRSRGMNRWHDLVDWIGGYPFEVAKPEEVFDFFRSRGFELRRLKTCGGRHGCNEFVLVRTPPKSHGS